MLLNKNCLITNYVNYKLSSATAPGGKFACLYSVGILRAMPVVSIEFTLITKRVTEAASSGKGERLLITL